MEGGNDLSRAGAAMETFMGAKAFDKPASTTKRVLCTTNWRISGDVKQALEAFMGEGTAAGTAQGPGTKIDASLAALCSCKPSNEDMGIEEVCRVRCQKT